jgi:DNA-binding transcriptional LysR family regulator
MKAPRVSLEQWRALVAVVEAGGYAQAAERLNKSQSTISYAIHRIEEVLDLRILEMAGRKAVLTPAGELLLRRARALIQEAGRLETGAQRLAAGWEATLRIAAEIIFPTWMLLECLQQLAAEHDQLEVQLHESVLGGTTELLAAGSVDLAITSSVPGGFIGNPLMQVRFIAAAAPHHPLFQLGRPLTLEDLRGHRHLIVRDSATQPQLVAEGAPRVTQMRWTTSAKATSIRAACMGLGFAWYAEDSIHSELTQGLLKPLPLMQGSERWASLYLVFADHDSIGPAANKLAELLHSAASRNTFQG